MPKYVLTYWHDYVWIGLPSSNGHNEIEFVVVDYCSTFKYIKMPKKQKLGVCSVLTIQVCILEAEKCFALF